MYAEEFLPDDAVFDDEMDISIDDTSTIDTYEIERKKLKEMYRRTDPDYYYFKRYEESPDGSLRLTRVRIYSSPSIGLIRNAPTGIREEHNVGSKYEDLYFSVKDTTAHTPVDRTPRKLFYRSPEEYERHFKVEVPESVKTAWLEKKLLRNASL